MARTASNGKKIGTPGQRQLRVGELIRHELANILSRGEIREPELEGAIVTVPEVRLTPDLKIATCFVMPLGGKNADGVVEALDRHRKYLRGEIARRINMKFAADLRFKVDTSFAEGARIDKLIRSNPVIRRDLDAAETAEDGDDE